MKLKNEETICAELQKEINIAARRETNSLLRRRDYDRMSTLNFVEVVEEVKRLCPTMYKVLSATLGFDSDDFGSIEKNGNMVLALIYGLIMFRHFKELSLIQRVNTILLIDAGANLKVSSYFTVVSIHQIPPWLPLNAGYLSYKLLSSMCMLYVGVRPVEQVWNLPEFKNEVSIIRRNWGPFYG